MPWNNSLHYEKGQTIDGQVVELVIKASLISLMCWFWKYPQQYEKIYWSHWSNYSNAKVFRTPEPLLLW